MQNESNGVPGLRTNALKRWHVVLGFVREGIARSAESHRGQRIDLVCYSLIGRELDEI